MINALHLLWIVPLAAAVGLFGGCMIATAAQEDERMEIRKGEQER